MTKFVTPHVMYKQGVIAGPQIQREVRSDSKSGSDVHFGVLFFVKYSYVSNGVALPQKNLNGCSTGRREVNGTSRNLIFAQDSPQ